MTASMNLATARAEALDVRRRYEVLERRLNGRTWSLHELMIGFSGDVGQIGRLLLAHDGTWPIDGDTDAELKHKLSEALWWVFVLADELDIDIDRAFTEAMSTIRTGLDATINRTPLPIRPTESSEDL